MSALANSPPSREIGIAIAGGLGNQMFQYAAARALALRHGAGLRLDPSFYGARRHRVFQLSRLPIAGKIEDRNWSGLGWVRRRAVPSYAEPHFGYDPAFVNLVPPVRLSGYFQSARYFEGYEDVVRAELSPPMPQDDESIKLATALASGDWVAMHVRRGDYVLAKNRALLDMCGVGYYDDALRLLPKDVKVLVLSDDVAWAAENLRPIREMTFCGLAGPRDGLADLWLMTRARYHIIANSSFSWWGAWLAGRKDGAVIAPQRWFGDPAIDTVDLIPPGWQRLPN